MTSFSVSHSASAIALAGLLVVPVILPAHAEEHGDWRGRRPEGHYDHRDYDHRDYDHRGGGGGAILGGALLGLGAAAVVGGIIASQPPYAYAPPPPVYYAPPPPAYYAPPPPVYGY